LKSLRNYIDLIESAQRIVAEAPVDSKFAGFMNKTLGQKVDAADNKSNMPDFMQQAPIAGLDSMGYKAALNFGLQIINRLTPAQKIKLAAKGEMGVVDWLTTQANKQGLLNVGDDDNNKKFVEEDLYEVQDFLSDVFKDPAITSWVSVLTDGNATGRSM
jgi:hypothetical protein